MARSLAHARWSLRMLLHGRLSLEIPRNSSNNACCEPLRNRKHLLQRMRRPPPSHKPAARRFRIIHMPRPPIQLLIVIIDLAGGTGTFCRALATGLKKFFPCEFKISLLILRGTAPPDENQFFDHIQTLNSNVHRDWRRWIESPAHILRLSHSINRINPDLILTVNTYSNILVPLAAPRRRVILSVHSNSTQQLTESRFGRPISLMMRWIYPRRTLVAPTQGVADDLQKN